MKAVCDKELLPCKCGGKARYRYRLPMHWVECRNKKCPYGMSTRYFVDIEGHCDPYSRDLAVEDWNRMVK